MHTPKRPHAAASSLLKSPERRGLRPTVRKLQRIGDDDTLRLVQEAVRDAPETVAELLQPDGSGFLVHVLNEMDDAGRVALASRVVCGWHAEMYVDATETITLGRNKFGKHVVGEHPEARRIPTAPHGSTADVVASAVRQALVGSGPHRCPLAVTAYANDEVIVETAPWEVAATQRVAALTFAGMGVVVTVRAVPAVTPALWDAPLSDLPPAVRALFVVTAYLEADAVWSALGRRLRPTLGTLVLTSATDEGKAIQEGFHDGRHVAVVVDADVKAAIPKLRKELLGLATIPDGVHVHVAVAMPSSV